MSNARLKGKASEFHASIRRQRLEAIFKQKRSKQKERNAEFVRKREQIQEELSRKFTEQKKTISQQHSTQQLVEVWRYVKEKILSSEQKHLKSDKKEDLRRTMTDLCNLVSLGVKQLNDYNEYEKHRLLQVVSGCQESSQHKREDEIQEKLMERLHVLWEIFELAGRELQGLLQGINQIQKEDKEVIGLIESQWFWYLQWCNLMVELTYLKLPSYQPHYDVLINTYKQTPHHKMILDFTTKVKLVSLTETYPICFKSVQKIMNFQQPQDSEQDIEKVEFVLGLFYVLGNIITDYQPNSLKNTISTLDSTSHLFHLIQDKNQLDKIMFGIEHFEQILFSLQSLRYQQYKKSMNFSFPGNEEIFVQRASIFYRDYIDLVQIQLWFCRLLMIEGWLDFSLTDFSNHSHIEAIFTLIMTISLEAIANTVNLVDKLQIQSQHYIRKAAQYLSELILLCELCVRQCPNPSLSTRLPKNVSKLNYHFSQLSINTLQNQNKPYYEKSLWKMAEKIKNFMNCVVKGSLMKKNTDLNLLNQIWNDLINFYETIITLGLFDISDCEDLVNFLVQCSKGLIICSSVLTLPMLVIRTANDPENLFAKSPNSPQSNIILDNQIHLKAQFVKHLSPYVYKQFVKSLDTIVPIFLYNKERMIQEDSEFKKTGKFNSEYMKMIYVQSRSYVLNYFIENLSMRKQQDFYSNYVLMLEQCFIYYQNGMTHRLQQTLVRSGKAQNFISSLQMNALTNEDTQNFSNQPQKQIDSYLSVDFMHKLLYFMVEELSKFKKSSSIHLQVLRFLRLVISSFSSQDQDVENELKHMIEYNVHGIKEYFEDMALWQSSEVNQHVESIFQLLEIQ